ncbi:MAG: hypothetical protein AAFY88_06830, partial [Acidobacteriota bacterium]
FYGGHRPLTAGLDAALPGILNLGEIPTLDVLDDSRLLSRYAREQPETFKALMPEFASSQGCRRHFEVGIRWQRRDYKRHLLRLGREIRTGEFDDDGVDFDAMLKEHAALYFYMRVVLPGFLVFQTLPIRELRRLRLNPSGADAAKAVERLVRMDPQAPQLVEVRRWINVEDGATRRQRQDQVQAWSRQGLGGGKHSPQRLKAVLGAVIQVAVERMGRYIDFVNPGLQPASISAAQVRRLFDAVAIDRAGRGREASMQVDTDLAEMQPGSWATQLRRYRPLVDHLFDRPGRLEAL